MKKRVLSLTMAFLLAFTMLPTQAAAEELPEYEEVVEENASEEDPLEKDVLETESLEAEAPAAEVENTERTVLTEETEETVTETEPAEEPTEEVTEAPTGEENEEPEVKEEVPAEQEETEEVPTEEIQPAEQQVSIQAMEANGVAVQAEDGETECTHPNATETEWPDCGITWCIKDDAGTKYTSLKDAFDNAPDGSMLTLMTDTYDRNDYKIIDKKYTIDPAGHTLDSWNIYIYRKKNPASLTLTGSGKVKVSINLGSNADLNLPKTWNGSIKTVNILSGSHNSTKIAGGTIDSLVLYVNKLSISGGTFGEIRNNLDSKIWAPALLESGYVFKQGNQAIEFSRDLSANESLWNVTVEKCEEHRDKNNDNNNDNKCDFCNQKFTVCVETTDKDGSTAKYSGLQGAFNETQDGATVKLLADIPAGAQNAAYIVDGKQLTLDLNGKTISGSGISATNGANLTITGNGTVDGELTFDSKSTGKLSGGKFGKVVSNNSDKTLEDLLEKGYTYRDYEAYKWKQNITESSIDKVEVQLAPIREVEITNHVEELTYGYSADAQQYIQAKAILQGSYADLVDYRWYEINEAGEALSEYVYENPFFIPTGLKAGKHTYRVDAACSSYVLKADVTFEVEKAASTVTTAPAAQKLTYTGEDQHLVTAGSTSDGELVYSLEKEGTYTPAIPTGKAAQEYTVWYKVKGDANHKDSEPASVTATISYLATDAAATLAETNKGQNGWYTSTVTIQAPAGYTISSTLEGTYAADFTTDTNGENTYYLRQDSSGFITDAKTIQVPIDTDQPSGGKTDLSDAALRVGWYLSKENITVTQSVEDATSGPDHIEYQLTPSTDSAGTLGSN